MTVRYRSSTIGISFSHASGMVTRAFFPICATSSSEKIRTISSHIARGVPAAVNPFAFFRTAPAYFFRRLSFQARICSSRSLYRASCP